MSQHHQWQVITQQPTTTTHTHLEKTPTPWSPLPTSFQRLQFYRWVGSPYNPLLRICATRRCNFFMQNQLILYLFTILSFYVQQLGALADKRWVFGTITCPFLWLLRQNDTHWPHIRQYFVPADAAQVFILFWHDFGWVGWGHHDHVVQCSLEVGCVLLTLLRV